MSANLYPAAPAQVPAGALVPSAHFKQEVGKVIFSIILFFIVYLILMVAAVALAIGCFYLGGMLIINFPRFFTIAIGLGMMALGVSVVFFLIKFIFAVSKNENPNRVEITEAEQPQLFAFIRQLTTDTKTPFPKKIYLSPDVNASVFYNSSFWSMFLPVRKNLEIGLGLVNSVNISEFKAVMAHEFGHFSQRSMKLGSFTYNVNQVIYNMLFENNSYSNFLGKWGSISGYTAIFANITVKIATGIQYILRQMYKFINKSYFGLSREMEFHADAVAASVSGGNNLVSALGRIELAADCYNSVLKTAGTFIDDNKSYKNIFENQLTLFRRFATEHKLPVKGGLPEISTQFIQSFSTSRINYKNQWASHPTLEQRQASLEKLNITAVPDETPAWQLFTNSHQWQEQLTTNLYAAANIDKKLEPVDGQYFENWLQKEKAETVLPEAYRGFYNGRLPEVKDWNLETICEGKSTQTFDALFNEANGRIQAGIRSNEADIETLKAIQQKEIDISSFDFDGRKYKRGACEGLISQLEAEVAADKKRLNALDEEAYCFFYQQAGEQGNQIKELYQSYQNSYHRYDQYVATANAVMDTIRPFYEGQVSQVTITLKINELKSTTEKNLKTSFDAMLNEGIITDATKCGLKLRIENFNAKSYAYFVGENFVDAELNELRNLTIDVANELAEQRYDRFRKMVEGQLALSRNSITPIVSP